MQHELLPHVDQHEGYVNHEQDKQYLGERQVAPAYRTDQPVLVEPRQRFLMHHRNGGCHDSEVNQVGKKEGQPLQRRRVTEI